MPGDGKTEKATPKKRRDERKKGNVFLSKDAVTVATLFGSFWVLKLTAVPMVVQFYQFFCYCMDCAGKLSTGETGGMLNQLVTQAIWVFIKTAGPMLAVTVLVAAAATFAQTRGLFSFSAIKPKFNRISILEGVKRLFSLRSIMETLKGTLKIIVLIYLIYHYLVGVYTVFAQYLYTDLAQTCQSLFDQTFSMVMQIALAFTALAAFDFGYQWWEYERQMKMSKQEIKEEYKQMEGDPQVKGKIKDIQRKMAQSRMMQQVPDADVIIRNPTHFAVALRYKQERDPAPVVLAKGQDELAQRIVQVAEEHHILTVENVPLARALYATAEIGQEIPPELYGEVAEVLVYLYRV
ncbi:MAG: flagellar biosynthesis protein FlhB, partial [Oscillospiraceae bacterium]